MFNMTYEEYMGEPFRMWHNGVDLSGYFHVLEVTGRSLSPNEIQSLTVPGMDGSYIQKKRKPGVPLKVKVMLTKNSDTELREAIDELNGILDSDNDVPIVFGDEPEKTYYGILSDISEGLEVNGTHIVTITFFRGDPYKYGPEITVPFSSDEVTITNNGTAAAKPIFELEVLTPVTFAMIENQKGEHMMIGRPVTADELVVEPTTTILNDSGDSTVGWTTASSIPDGVVSGQVSSIDGKLRASDYGTGTGWHGPVIKKSLSEPLQDFNVQVLIEFNEAIADNTGRIQFSLLDINNNVIGMLSFFDIYTQWFDMVGRAEIGNNYLVSDRDVNWGHSFTGKLTMQRQGQEIIAKIQKLRDGEYKDTIEGKFTDYLNQHQTPVAQIQLHFGAYGTHTRPFMAVDNIQVLKLNDTTNKVPYIAGVGDVITFDHVNENIMLNDDSIISEKEFIAEYFKIHPKENQLAVYPKSSFNVSVTYRERFK